MKYTELLFSLLLLTFSVLSLSTSFHHNQNYYEAGKQQQERKHNPFIFGEESFEHLVSSEHGSIKVLKLLPELSPLLHGIANYRLGYIETDPLTFLVPKHISADFILYVDEGEGVIVLLHEGSRESHSLQKGDILRVWAGSIIYLVNKSKNQKLKLIELLHPVGNTGRFHIYYSAGRDEVMSFYRGFSIELLEAALNTPRDRLHQLFGHQRREIITRESEEKIRAITEHSSKRESIPGYKNKPFNLLKKRPSYKNNRGQLFEADCKDYEQLKDLNVQVTYTNISRGSMLAPFFNTRSFKIAVVMKGSGYVEIIYPEDKEMQKQSGTKDEEQHMLDRERYTTVSSQLSVGSVIISPPGHPTVIVANKEQNLQMVCFEIQAENNELVFIAGKNNILVEMEDVAKELTFGVPAKMVDEVLRGKDEVFMAGPREWEGGGKHERTLMKSIREVVEGF